MTHEQAMQILDARREGADVPVRIVEKALEMTGDIEPEPEPIWMKYTAVEAISE